MRANPSPSTPLVPILTGLSTFTACLFAFAVPVLAQSLTIVQLRQANVFGVVQSGREVRPVNVTQTGQANAAGIVQVGSNPRASITQNGQSNTAFVGQYQPIAPRGGRLQLP